MADKSITVWGMHAEVGGEALGHFSKSAEYFSLSCVLVGMGIVFVTTSMRRNQWLVFDWSAFVMFSLLIVILLVSLRSKK